MPERNSLRYFADQIVEFRQLMGDRRFWENARKVELAKKAIATQYLALTIPKSELNEAATYFDAAMIEFTRRAAYMDALV